MYGWREIFWKSVIMCRFSFSRGFRGVRSSELGARFPFAFSIPAPTACSVFGPLERVFYTGERYSRCKSSICIEVPSMQ